jgi:hypothetical protein
MSRETNVQHGSSDVIFSTKSGRELGDIAETRKELEVMCVLMSFPAYYSRQLIEDPKQCLEVRTLGACTDRISAAAWKTLMDWTRLVSNVVETVNGTPT